MATTIEIPKSEWLNFCDLFSRQHEGRLAIMEVAGTDLGDQLETQRYSFHGISYDPKGTGRDSIDIELGADPGRHVNHAVSRPRRVMLLLTEEGAHEGLDIESEDGTKTIVRFQTTQMREQIAGVVNENISRRMQELIGRLVQKKRRAGE